MKICLAATLLAGTLMFAQSQPQSQTPNPSNPTQSPDVPKEQPRDNNPDLGAQRTPTPGGTNSGSDTTNNTAGKKTKGKRHNKQSGTSSTQK